MIKEDVTPRVCIVGAGVMGRGVSLAFIAAGVDVCLIDRTELILDAAVQDIRRCARLYGMIDRGFTVVSPTEIASRLTCSVDIQSASNADFVVENVTEDWETKEAVYKQLDRICRSEVIFAVNTSAIPINRVAHVTARPERVIGMHFMNPAPLKHVVEVIRGPKTANSSIEIACSMLTRIGKEAIVVADSPGFVTNRVMMLMVNETIRVLEEGIASATQIDHLFRSCFGHRMGPLETADLIGLDTVKLSLDVLYGELGEDRFLPAKLLAERVGAGKLGRKSGAGFFNYDVTGST